MADYGILYNNVPLQTAVPKAQVTDIVIQPIPIEWKEVARIARHGSRLVRNRNTKRNVTIKVELPLVPNVAALTTNVRKLRTWAEANEELPLILPDFPGKYLSCVLTGISSYSISDWYKPVELTFTAFNDPFFVSFSESTGSVGTTFAVRGDEPVEPIIEHQIAETLTNPAWKLADGFTLALAGTFTSGMIRIDTGNGYVSRNGESIMQYLTPSSRFCQFPKGNHLITGPSGGTITWRERWRD